MSDATERQAELEEQYTETLLGVVLPGDPEQEPPLLEVREYGTDFEVAASVVFRAQDAVRERLALLRAEREALRIEIRSLVADEDRLGRMARIAAVAAENTETGEPGEPE